LLPGGNIVKADKDMARKLKDFYSESLQKIKLFQVGNFVSGQTRLDIFDVGDKLKLMIYNNNEMVNKNITKFLIDPLFDPLLEPINQLIQNP
jgi:hypothetical protein